MTLLWKWLLVVIGFAGICVAECYGDELYAPLPQTLTWSAPSELVEQVQVCLDTWNSAVNGRFTFLYAGEGDSTYITSADCAETGEGIIWAGSNDAAATIGIYYWPSSTHLINCIAYTYSLNQKRVILVPPHVTTKILLHELGHAFGLAHTDPDNCYGYYLPLDDPPIMNVITMPVGIDDLRLHTDDIYRIRRLYGLSLDVATKLNPHGMVWCLQKHRLPQLRRIYHAHKHMLLTLRGQFVGRE